MLYCIAVFSLPSHNATVINVFTVSLTHLTCCSLRFRVVWQAKQPALHTVASLPCKLLDIRTAVLLTLIVARDAPSAA